MDWRREIPSRPSPFNMAPLFCGRDSPDLSWCFPAASPPTSSGASSCTFATTLSPEDRLGIFGLAEFLQRESLVIQPRLARQIACDGSTPPPRRDRRRRALPRLRGLLPVAQSFIAHAAPVGGLGIMRAGAAGKSQRQVIGYRQGCPQISQRLLVLFGVDVSLAAQDVRLGPMLVDVQVD